MNARATTILGLFLLTGFVAFGLLVKEAVIKGREFDRYFTVRGLSEQVVKSTVVIWPIRYSVSAEDLPTLKRDMESVQKEVAAFLEQNGIGRDEYSVGLPTVEDTISSRRRDDAVVLPRYTATTPIVVRSTKVDVVKAAAMKSTGLLDKGITLVSDEYADKIQFSFEGVNELKPKMIEEATANARAAADKFAADSHAKVGAIRRATQGAVEISERDQASPELKVVRVVTTIEFFIE